MPRTLPSVPSVEIVEPARDLDPSRDLSARIADLEAAGPDLQRQGQAAGWPKGISPAVSWALKRLERWRKGDQRPVRVLILPGKRCLASIDEAQPDGAVVRPARAAGGVR